MSHASPGRGARGPGAVECASIAWRALMAAPMPHFGAGLLFLLIVLVFPIMLPGPLWVGMCTMALASLRGEAPSIEQFFAPFGDRRARAAWLYGLLLTVIMVGSQIIGVAILAGAVMGMLSGAPSIGTGQQAFVIEVTLAFLIMLLPYVFMAYYLFPVGFYIANGETDFRQALRRGMAEVGKRRAFWSSFWSVMMFGHLIGIFACCIGIAAVLPWNCLAMGAGLMAQDPELAAPTRSPATVPSLRAH